MPPIRHSDQKATQRKTLNDIFDGPDEFGLLDAQSKRSGSHTPLEVSRFEEINQFIDQHGHLPGSSGDIAEKALARRLNGYIVNAAQYEGLRQDDRHRLLPVAACSEVQEAEQSQYLVKGSEADSSNHEVSGTNRISGLQAAEAVTSLDDIFASDAFAELDSGDNSLFDMRHVAASNHRESPDEIAQRKKCEDFYAFESTFSALHEKITANEVQVERFKKESQIEAGDSFILQGVICFVDEVGAYQKDEQGRYNPRLRVIFENGMESNLLLRSLARALYKDKTGRRVVRPPEDIEDAFNNITHRDKRSGEIYFVTTKSDNPALKVIPNLVKIGYTELTVEERTKNAERDTAFLEAPVKILASTECYNLNPHKFESLVHGFLHAQRLTITLTGKDGKDYHPKEWFSVPLDTAREVVKHIIKGTIVEYRIDNTTGRLVKKA